MFALYYYRNVDILSKLLCNIQWRCSLLCSPLYLKLFSKCWKWFILLTNEDLSEEKRKEKVEIYIYLYKVKRRQIIKPESILRSNFLNNLKLRLQKYQENVAFLAELKIKILFKHASLIENLYYMEPFFLWVFIQCEIIFLKKMYISFHRWRVKKLFMLNFS